MAEEIITLVSKEYAETNFIEQGKYTELENQVSKNTTSITNLGNTVNTVKGDVDDLKPEVATLEQSVEGNTQAITILEQSVAGKQDQLTSDNAGDNITITGSGSTLKINAAGGGELKAKTWVCELFTTGADCNFYNIEYHFNAGEQTDIESIHVYDQARAIIKFTEEKSLAEVNKWLMFEAKLTDNDAAGYVIANDYDKFVGGFTPLALCPWPEDKPWPGAN